MRRSAGSFALALLAGWSAGCGEAATPQRSAAVPEGKRVLVEVLNGSGRRGLARAATRVLRQAGFDVVYFGTVGETGAPTVALARRGDSAAAARVARALGASAVRVATDTLLRLDVTVILGADYRPPPGLRP
jgi:Fe-S oxidoreductase